MNYKILLALSLGLILTFEVLNFTQNIYYMNTTSKTDLKELALQSIEAVKNGEADALPEYIEARKHLENNVIREHIIFEGM